jgi:hypothetical protein
MGDLVTLRPVAEDDLSWPTMPTAALERGHLTQDALAGLDNCGSRWQVPGDVVRSNFRSCKRRVLGPVGVRGHQEIENRLHWVRDITYQEDKSRSEPGTRPA